MADSNLIFFFYAVQDIERSQDIEHIKDILNHRRDKRVTNEIHKNNH